MSYKQRLIKVTFLHPCLSFMTSVWTKDVLVRKQSLLCMYCSKAILGLHIQGLPLQFLGLEATLDTWVPVQLSTIGALSALGLHSAKSAS